MAITRSNLEALSSNILFSYSKFGPTWLYQLSVVNPRTSPALNRVVSFCLTLVTKAFNPEKYGTLCKVLADTYASSGTPVKVLHQWLGAVRGAPLNGYDPLAFPKNQALLATSIKGTRCS